MEISILPNTYRNSDGTFNMNSSLKLCGQIAGVCYSKHGFSSLEKESEDKTLNRIETTLNNGHHSVYDHVNVTLNIKNIPNINKSYRVYVEGTELYTNLSIEIATDEEEIVLNEEVNGQEKSICDYFHHLKGC